MQLLLQAGMLACRPATLVGRGHHPSVHAERAKLLAELLHFREFIFIAQLRVRAGEKPREPGPSNGSARGRIVRSVERNNPKESGDGLKLVNAAREMDALCLEENESPRGDKVACHAGNFRVQKRVAAANPDD